MFSKFLRWLGGDRAMYVSDRWLNELDADQEVEFHGVCIDWPIDKARDARGWRNRVELREQRVA